MIERWLVASIALVLGACGERAPAGDLIVSVVGPPPRMVDPDRAALRAGDAVLASATATGLVAFDAAGQIAPALAESWIVADDGRSIIFRLRRMNWPGGREITGDEVAGSLDRAIAGTSRNRLKPLLSAVEDVVGMTGRVVEVRLKVPRPQLLQLLAQPELGVRKAGSGIGPYAARVERGTVMLTPLAADDAQPPTQRRIRLRGERAALAVVRFVANETELVLGGTVADWPIANIAATRRGRLRLDPAEGLFGLAVVGNGAFLGAPAVRDALAMTIDRPALGALLDVPGWTPMETILPARLDSAAPAARPRWSGRAAEQRVSDATRAIAEWRAANGDPPTLRIALPTGPGGRLILARLNVDWRRIGVSAVAVPINAAGADLRLVDAVAPGGSANWYLTSLACATEVACGPADDSALTASRRADSLSARAALIAAADLATTERTTYIPLGRPIRWSLVGARLTGWRDNAVNAHPLGELVAARR